MTDQAGLDAALQDYYTYGFDESARLTTRSAQGALEFVRVQEILAAHLHSGSAVVDIGGGTGTHAAALAAAGHDVTLLDPVESHVVDAHRHGTFAAEVGDARYLRFDTDTFDAALLFGPLYHLRLAADRNTSLREATRVVRPGGHVLAAAVPRFSRLILALQADAPPPTWELTRLLQEGTPPSGSRFPAGHFHTGDELEAELNAAGLKDVEVYAVEGAAGLTLEQLPGGDSDLLAAALTIARSTGHLRAARDISNHLIGVGRVP